MIDSGWVAARGSSGCRATNWANCAMKSASVKMPAASNCRACSISLCRLASFRWPRNSASSKASILGESAGFVKIVAEAKYDEILGVHIVGPHATELIAEAEAALRGELTAEDLIHTIHAHPTLAEALGEAAHAAVDWAIHI